MVDPDGEMGEFACREPLPIGGRTRAAPLASFIVSIFLHAGAVFALANIESAPPIEGGAEEIPVEIIAETSDSGQSPLLQQNKSQAIESPEPPVAQAEPAPPEPSPAAPATEPNDTATVSAPSEQPALPSEATTAPAEVALPSSTPLSPAPAAQPDAQTTVPVSPSPPEPLPAASSSEPRAPVLPTNPPSSSPSPMESPVPREAAAPLPAAPSVKPQNEAAERRRQEALQQRKREEAEARERKQEQAAAEAKRRKAAEAKRKAEAEIARRAAAEASRRRQISAEIPAAARPPTVPESGANVATYRSSVLRRLASFKQYPESARARGAQGEAVVSFTLDNSGRVVGAKIIRSSGQADIDAATLAMVRRASPFPPPPSPAAKSFSPAINFRLE